MTVKFIESTPEELTYEPPDDVSDPKRFPTLAVGRKEWQQFLSLKRGYVRLRPDLRKAFPTEESVNDALEAVLKLQQMRLAKSKNRKTA